MEKQSSSGTLARTGGTTSKPSPERVFFIVDRSRLKEETDEFKDAVVVYVPDGDLKKPNLEQRCSQLIGISILILNFTNKMPKFIQLRSNGFAIRSLGDTTFIMGLQSKFDEPKSSVMNYLDRIHDFFMFSYFSANKVMEMSQGDWEIFTIQMTAIFQSVMDFTFRQSHSLPSMFSPLPYISLDTERGGTRLFLQAHRLLKKIQLKKSVIGGCIFYNRELLCSQLPPAIAEKLLFVSNGGVDLNRRSILDDGETPESVWVIEVYLSPEELADLAQIKRTHQELSSFYSSLTSDPDIAASVFRHERVTNNDQKKSEIAPLYRADSGGSADFVTISYGKDSVSFSHQIGISPLKRPKANRGLSHSQEDDYSEILPTQSLPVKMDEAPPPLPPKPGPPPVPTRNSVKLRPVPPPRTISVKRQQDATDDSDTSIVTQSVPVSTPISNGKQWLYGTLPDVLSEDTPVSPGVYGTPSSGFMTTVEDRADDSHDSDASDGFGTPPSTSPVHNDHSLSTSDTLTVSQPFLTPLVTSLVENPSTGSTEEPSDKPKVDIYATLDRSDELNVSNDSQNSHNESTDPVLEDKQGRNPKISNSSLLSNTSSLVITKAISEPSLNSELNAHTHVPDGSPDKGDHESSLDDDHHQIDETHSLQSASPNHDVNESNSEFEDQIGEMDLNFPSNKMRPRAESWVKTFTGVVEDEASMAKRASALVRKTVYIQKCVNTVLVVVTHTDLPEDHNLVRSLWKNTLTHLLCINNTVQSCVLEKDSLYVAGDSVKSDGPKTYQAMYSGLTGNCEVSSSTAPYQFRHAVRRAHQEYISDPSLRQLSLCKEYCRMFCQNTMGRESYLHTTRTVPNDSFVIHAMLERQAKSMRKHHEQHSTDFNDAPNLSFL
ncbi:PREDICTED: uncharacterized protein LOC109583798 [Amphimedon queenslandica]|uniref:CCZ1/INTU/HSP4 first Longin domain-containing protein n=1 Tax=Amphimedon queenslandica TaxID=400682 RepID=A0A1X7UDI9_AMPQE|nr:PREDICTED: uncharacterized protein LOC109583798 [Amphimedon queenslandica]|eukprot:XP_019854830.1 PREDICTED: uncharacterized protein LOC109583798 [Amphimedon queenslandica]